MRLIGYIQKKKEGTNLKKNRQIPQAYHSNDIYLFPCNHIQNFAYAKLRYLFLLQLLLIQVFCIDRSLFSYLAILGTFSCTQISTKISTSKPFQSEHIWP